MYNIGTVTTTANSPKITGTGTRWKDNTTLISVGQVVLIENGANLLINSIYSIESNTALTLAFPLSAKLTNAKYIILTTMIDSISDGVNKATAQVIASEAYTDILNQWMTAQGTIDVELPTGQKVKLRTVAEMDKQLDRKLDKTGGELSDSIKVKKSGSAIQVQRTGAQSNYVEFLDVDGARRALIGFGDAADNLTFMNSKSGTSLKIIADGRAFINGIEIMKVGDFGWGGASPLLAVNTDLDMLRSEVINRVYTLAGSYSNSPVNEPLAGVMLIYCRAGGYTHNQYTQIVIHNGIFYYRHSTATSWGAWFSSYSTANTTKDANGNLKAASPIVKVFADDIDVNEESEGVTLKKLHTGIYQLCGVLGMHSDASWGGVNGGITIPSGINQLPLIYVDYDVLVAGERHPFNGEIIQQDEHGDIVIYTSYRKHYDLPQNVQYARLKAYPEFTKSVNDEQVELENGEPVDIPCGHWIDVRVNMPSNSIYNQKQAAAEAHAKEEAERVAREKAERAEQEAAERE